jgi:DNA-binding CsgD family transcriptional regulator
MWSRHRLPHRLAKEGGVETLSLRQMDVLRLRCCEEMTNAEVAEARNLAESTVKNTMTVVFRKLGRVSIAGACYDLCHDEYKPTDAMRAESV